MTSHFEYWYLKQIWEAISGKVNHFGCCLLIVIHWAARGNLGTSSQTTRKRFVHHPGVLLVVLYNHHSRSYFEWLSLDSAYSVVYIVGSLPMKSGWRLNLPLAESQSCSFCSFPDDTNSPGMTILARRLRSSRPPSRGRYAAYCM